LGREVEKRLRGGLRFVGEVLREDDPDADVEVAVAVALEMRHALTLEPELATVLGALGELEHHPALQGPDLDLAPEEGLLERDRDLAFEIGAG
jgi:hypothetical protein